MKKIKKSEKPKLLTLYEKKMLIFSFFESQIEKQEKKYGVKIKYNVDDVINAIKNK